MSSVRATMGRCPHPASRGEGHSERGRSLAVLLVALVLIGLSACAPPRRHTGPVPVRLLSAEMGRDLPVLMGISTPVLDRGGAGWDPESSGLTEAGTVVLFAHRVSHGAPFRTLDRLRPGNLIFLQGTDGHLYQYQVTKTEITRPSWAAVLAWKPATGWGLTLVACHPPGSVYQRIVVHAELIRIV